MKNRFLTIILILGIAAFIYYNKSSFLEKRRTRLDLENSIEEVTGFNIDLKGLFKGIEDVNDDLTSLGEDRVKEMKRQLEKLSKEERETLLKLLEDKGDEGSSLFQDFVENIKEGEND
jgi:hypothetical protein